MKGTWIATVAASAALSLSGCGTVCNLASEKPEIYGGVARDLEFAQTPNPGAPITGGTSAKEGVAFFLGLYLADLSLSLVGDTLTLPVLLYHQGRIAAAKHSTVPAPGGPPGRQPQYSAGGTDPAEHEPGGPVMMSGAGQVFHPQPDWAGRP